MDRETGLYYYGARYMEPKLSRWMSADPAGFEIIDPQKNRNYLISGTNWYSYSENNPIVYKDPDGKLPAPVIGAVTGAFAGSGLLALSAGSFIGGSSGSVTENIISHGAKNLNVRAVAWDALIDGGISVGAAVGARFLGKRIVSARVMRVRILKPFAENLTGLVADMGQDNLGPNVLKKLSNAWKDIRPPAPPPRKKSSSKDKGSSSESTESSKIKGPYDGDRGYYGYSGSQTYASRK